MGQTVDRFEPGMIVEITQQFPRRDKVWTTKVRGEVIRYEQKTTGSWFAHSKNDKLWLDRLTIRREDGEISIINLDRYTHIELIEGSNGNQPAA